MRTAPKMLFADEKGIIFDHPYFEMAGASGQVAVRPDLDDLVPLPEMSRLYFHPNCPPYGYDPKEKRIVPVTETRIGRKKITRKARSRTIFARTSNLCIPEGPDLPYT